MANEVKAVFFDIDGTLIPFGDSGFPPSTRLALEKLKERGIKIFIATGRPVKIMRHVLDMFDFDGYLAMNGQYCCVDGRIVRDRPLKRENVRLLLPYLYEEKITCVFAELDYLYLNYVSEAYLRQAEKQGGVRFPVDDLGRIEEHDLYQLMAYIEEDEEKEFFAHLPGCRAARWCPDFTDVIPADGGKAVGMDAMAGSLGVTMSQVMAFGDGGNDIDMLEHAGLGVAMGNAGGRVKAAADYVTGDASKGGIYQALEHWGVIDNKRKR